MFIILYYFPLFSMVSNVILIKCESHIINNNIFLFVIHFILELLTCLNTVVCYYILERSNKYCQTGWRPNEDPFMRIRLNLITISSQINYPINHFLIKN